MNLLELSEQEIIRRNSMEQLRQMGSLIPQQSM